MKSELCERCGKRPWVAPAFLGERPTEVWCADCIQAELDSGINVAALGDYFETKKRKKVLRLIDQIEYLTNEARIELRISEIRELLRELWGEQ